MPDERVEGGANAPPSKKPAPIEIEVESVVNSAALRVKVRSLEEARDLLSQVLLHLDLKSSKVRSNGTTLEASVSADAIQPQVTRGPLDPALIELIKLKIREQRQRGINQGDIAKLAGIEPSQLSGALSGRVGLSPEKQHKLFEVLGIQQGPTS